ncbi:MAG TPA: hypothetical protein VNO55_01390, partial [Polyangia bacterium]|nr:hypothetical protein [Polyangia bacterium]
RTEEGAAVGGRTAGKNLGARNAGAGGDAHADVAATPDSSDAGQGLALMQYAATFARVSCAKVFACCAAADRGALFGATEADCTGKLELGENLFINTIADDVTMGFIGYDAAKAAACFDAIAATSCAVVQGAGDFTESIASCETHFLPRVALGGACLNSRDCLGGWCDAKAGMKCVPALGDGQPCDANAQCKKGSSCADSGNCAPEGSFCSGG